MIFINSLAQKLSSLNSGEKKNTEKARDVFFCPSGVNRVRLVAAR